CLLKQSGLYSRMSIGAVLLAAGAGTRMGGRPKALLELGGVPLVLRQLIALSGAGVDELVIVLGAHAASILPVIEHFPVTLVHNPRPGDGQISSQRLGLAALNPNLDAVLVALADQPLINEEDIASLIGAFKKRPDGTSVVVPRVAGQPGNPVIFSAAVRAEILAGDIDVGCRQWRDAHPAAVAHFDTDNRRFILDIDSPADIERFERDTGHALRWPAGLEAS
ncbi:MAG TPA: nucleotidyltransferase family protein, partial [Steroidobacteraceae bacterium]|nr:nucleotidyltransferase family protein [Steroidobacteraceae bacterium]